MITQGESDGFANRPPGWQRIWQIWARCVWITIWDFLRLHGSPHVLTAFGPVWVYLEISGAGCSHVQQFFVGRFCWLIEHSVRFLGNMSSKCSLLKSQHVGNGCQMAMASFIMLLPCNGSVGGRALMAWKRVIQRQDFDGFFVPKKIFALGVQWFTSAVGKHPRHQNKSFQVFELWTFPGGFMSMMYTCAWRIEGSICRPCANLAPKNHWDQIYKFIGFRWSKQLTVFVTLGLHGGW